MLYSAPSWNSKIRLQCHMHGTHFYYLFYTVLSHKILMKERFFIHKKKRFILLIIMGSSVVQALCFPPALKTDPQLTIYISHMNKRKWLQSTPISHIYKLSMNHFYVFALLVYRFYLPCVTAAASFTGAFIHEINNTWF